MSALGVVLTFFPRPGGWRNGRRARFRSVCPKGREGSNPSSPTRLGGRWSMTGGHLSFRPAPCWPGGTTPRNPPRGPASCTGPRRWPSSRRRGRPDLLRWPPTAFFPPFAVLVLLFRMGKGCHFSGCSRGSGLKNASARSRGSRLLCGVGWVLPTPGRMERASPPEPGLGGTFQIPGSCGRALVIPPCVTNTHPAALALPGARAWILNSCHAISRHPQPKLLLRVTVCHLDSSNINSILVTYAGADFAGQRAF
jgi:hypothetical protein